MKLPKLCIQMDYTTLNGEFIQTKISRVLLLANLVNSISQNTCSKIRFHCVRHRVCKIRSRKKFRSVWRSCLTILFSLLQKIEIPLSTIVETQINSLMYRINSFIFFGWQHQVDWRKCILAMQIFLKWFKMNQQTTAYYILLTAFETRTKEKCLSPAHHLRCNWTN